MPISLVFLSIYPQDTKSKDAVPVVASMIPRNEFREGKVQRADKDYGKWAMEVANSEGIYFIDLNAITADKYDVMGPEKTKEFFPGDHTHTNEAGATINAASVTEGIKLLKDLGLNKYLLNKN